MYYLLIFAIVVWHAFEHTPIGRYMFATGGNPDAARLAGVRTDRLVWASLVASTVIAGFAGLIYSWKVGTFSESIGPGYLFPAIAAVLRSLAASGASRSWLPCRSPAVTSS